MLRMFIDEKRDGIDALSFAPPYEWVVSFIGLEIGTRADRARFWIEIVRGAADGKPTRDVSGNAYILDADATTTELENPEKHVHRIPTPVLLEALERWLRHIERP